MLQMHITGSRGDNNGVNWTAEAVMPSHALNITCSNKRLLRRIAGVFYVAVTIVIVTVCLRDWSQTWRIVSSPPARQPHSLNVYSEVRLLKKPTRASVEKTGATVTKNTEIIESSPVDLESTHSTVSASTIEDRLPFEHKTTLTSTTKCSQHYFLLILVSSSPAYFDRRRTIRQTWAVDNSINTRWKTVFLLGQSRDKNHSELLQREGAFYGDLVRANYYEHYWNQTLKIEMGFEWAARYCSFQFLLKADDDVFINPPAVIAILNRATTPKDKLYMGFVYRNPLVKRTGKWSLTREEYKTTHYPDFCAGPGYILSSDVVTLFVSIFGGIPRFKFDDVYVGMLAAKMGLNAVHDRGFQTPPYLPKTCVLDDNTLVRHGAVGQCLTDLFQKSQIKGMSP
ncbi:Beta-1,3-galactosyltransferase 1 [Stylophora pistillata]|uniref:Hexosyltransferase n=1 Tax=Stylophora pistillata TaxID=50429 RepID=A0A2B4SA74_STYPI|nr:Beta-1,3-galactosyltransferase 1 [Stylophora pistillata]